MKGRGGFSLSFNVKKGDAIKMYSTLLRPHADDLIEQYKTMRQKKRKLPRKQKKKIKKKMVELISRASGVFEGTILKFKKHWKMKMP